MQLTTQLPLLLAYVTGMILALVFWRRSPGPSLLTLLATVLLLVIAVLQAFLFFYSVRARHDLGWSDERFGWMSGGNNLVGSVLRAGACGLLLIAVFMGRNAGQHAGLDLGLPRTGLASRPSEEVGITSRPGD